MYYVDHEAWKFMVVLFRPSGFVIFRNAVYTSRRQLDGRWMDGSHGICHDSAAANQTQHAREYGVFEPPMQVKREMDRLCWIASAVRLIRGYAALTSSVKEGLMFQSVRIVNLRFQTSHLASSRRAHG
jgi:hypothetical protein